MISVLELRWQVDGTRNPKVDFSAVHGGFLLKIAGLFFDDSSPANNLFYSIVSHLEFYFNIQLAAHRLSRTGFVLILVVFSFGCISVPYLQYGV